VTLTSVLTTIATEKSNGGFQGPSIDDFFPPAIFFAGTPFALNRIMLIRLLAVVVLVVLLWLGSRRMTVVPNRRQVALEFALGFVRNNVAIQTLGEKDGRRFLPVLMAIFFTTLSMNITGIIPGLQIAGSSLIGLPILMAAIAYVLFIYAGIRKHSWRFFRDSLFLPGVPWPLYFLLTPVELFSTFVLRPITLTLRLAMNMIAGHMLLALCFTATSFFFFSVLSNGNLLGLLGFGSLAFGLAFTLLDIFVAALQAYVFTILTAIYIQMAIADEH
jgi:F-type H+-transporting ATPase subunit a